MSINAKEARDLVKKFEIKEGRALFILKEEKAKKIFLEINKVIKKTAEKGEYSTKYEWKYIADEKIEVEDVSKLLKTYLNKDGFSVSLSNNQRSKILTIDIRWQDN